MDDYDVNTLIESKNEWCARLLNILTPQIIIGFKSVFQEAEKLCIENGEDSKYLMTFQNLLVNIPKWSQHIVETECKRIIEVTNCSYIEDLISCVHIIQLKALTACRVGLKQKKINIEIPSINNFIHQVYINCARKLYLNIYLFENNILPLQLQKNNRELEIIIKEVIMNTVRDSIPIENLLKAYLDETEETETVVEERHETVIDREKLDEEKARMRIKRELELEEEKRKESQESKVKDETNESKDELLNISAEIDELKNDLPSLNIKQEDESNRETNTEKNGETNTIIDKQQTVSLGKETTNISNINAEFIDVEDNKNNSSLEDNSNKLEDSINIDNNDFDTSLEIMDLDSIDNIEPDISLDIEELK